MNSVVTTDDFYDVSLKIDGQAMLSPSMSSANMSDSSFFLDYFKRHRPPNVNDLIENYKRLAYSCANINANAVSSVPLKLYVRTAKGDKQPRVRTKAVHKDRIAYLERQDHLQPYLKEFNNLEEVVEHPVLDLLKNVNETNLLNGTALRVLTQLYQEITGVCYYLINKDQLGRPIDIWILPSHKVTPKRNPNSKKIVDYYEFRDSGDAIKIPPEKILLFLMPHLNNPYLEAMGPLMASFEANQVSNKLISHENNFLSNEARPDAIISPTKDMVWGKQEAKILEAQFSQKFARGGGGKMWFADEPIEFTPLQFPPRDLARLEIHKWSKLDIANAFGVPIALLEGERIDRATLEAAMTQHALYGIKPRCDRNAAVLNDQLVSLYDDSGRLFFAYDDPVPENRELKMQETVQFVQTGILTPNEGRDRHNYPPLAGADELAPINVSPDIKRQEKRDSGEAER